MKKILFYTVSILLIFQSCTKQTEVGVQQGMKPIYTTVSTFNNISSEPPKSFTTVGKIFKIGNKIYISDSGTGVHVIDNSDPYNPQKEAFINIYGNNDMAVKQNTLYADNGSNLLAIDITDVNNVEVSSRIEDVYRFNGQNFPPDYFGYFECVDPEKGYVYDWVSVELDNPECRR